jgi:hypothetical protein
MIRIIAGLILLSSLLIAGILTEKKQVKEAASLTYVSIDTSLLTYRHQAYVPVNFPQKKVKRHQKVLLKVRNTSFTDSIYLSRVDYYNSQGILLNSSIDSALLIKPMATGEIMVKSRQLKDTVDNLIVQWHSNSTLKPIVQAITIDNRNRVVMNEEGIVLSDDLVATETEKL